MLGASTVIALVAPSAAAALTGPEEIAFLNAQRAAAGLPSDITEVPEWTEGCRLHMEYIRLNGGGLTHDEVEGRPGYTADGQAAGRTSVLTSRGSSFYPDGGNAFENAPIHLMQMLSPWMLRSGASGGCLATLRDLGRQFVTPSLYSYPGDGQSTPAAQNARESPFVPGDAVGLPEGTTTGPHLYVLAAGPGSHFSYDGRLTAATVTGPAGPVDVRVVDDASPEVNGTAIGPYLPPGGIIIPVAPLTPGTTYQATATYTPTDQALPPTSRAWSFTAVAGTVGRAPTPPESLPTPRPVPTLARPKPPTTPVPTTRATPRVSAVTLSRRSLRVYASNASTLRATIAERRARTVWVRTSKNRVKRVRRTTWVTRRTLLLTVRGGSATTKFKRLMRGRTYRVQVRATPTGRVLRTATRRF